MAKKNTLDHKKEDVREINEVTKKALEDVKNRKDLESAETVEELFKKLNKNKL